MRFFNIDLHISVIADLKNIFEKLGHHVTNWTLSGHSWVFGRSIDPVDVVNSSTWRDIDEGMCERFYQRYRNVLSEFDAFIVTHTPCFSLLFKKFDKPIIIVASTRYEEPFGGNAVKWAWFNAYLRDMIDTGKIIPIANNKYDARYCELFTDRHWKHIPSLCEYTRMNYTGRKDIFLLSSNFPVVFDWDKIRRKESELPSPYDWNDLAEYKGIIHLPYNCSTMSIFEQYTANIPLIFPSHPLFMELYDKYPGRGLLSQLSWNQVHGRPPGSLLPINYRQYDPNQYNDSDSISDWMRLADFYDTEWMPYITYFSSLRELKKIIERLDVPGISQEMRRFNAIRREQVYQLWEGILDNICRN